MCPQLSASRLLPVGVAAVLALFLVSVQLLGAATEAAAPFLERLFGRVLVGDATALGLGWLGAYALGNGSVIAALSLSLFTAGLVSASQLFLLIAGSRLGAAAIVVFVGVLDYAQKERYTVQESVRMGVLTFLLTHSIYLPVTLLGYLALPVVHDRVVTASVDWSPSIRPLSWTAPLTDAITTRLGPMPSVLLAVALLFGSLRLFDRLLSRVDTATIRSRFFSHFERTWVSFAIGLFVTGASTSVAFSLGVIVPLYNRGYVERDELVPYVLGANLGTLFDTLVVALVLESAVGVALVLELLGMACLVTVGALLVHDRYSRLVVAVDDRLLVDRRAFVAFALALLLCPLLLVVVPLVGG
jgi:sodium-dependent phosphate cotransporter